MAPVFTPIIFSMPLLIVQWPNTFALVTRYVYVHMCVQCLYRFECYLFREIRLFPTLEHCLLMNLSPKMASLIYQKGHYIYQYSSYHVPPVHHTTGQQIYITTDIIVNQMIIIDQPSKFLSSISQIISYAIINELVNTSHIFDLIRSLKYDVLNIHCTQ